MAIQKLFTSRVRNTLGTTFVGERGRLFYDELTGSLRLSDGVTPGGNPIHIHAANAIYDHSIIPAADNTYDLGSELLRWRSVHIGPGSLYLYDIANEITAELTIDNGVLKVNGTNQLQVGQLKFINNTIQSETPLVDITIGYDTDTANLIFNRNTSMATDKTISWGTLTGDYETEKFFSIGLDASGGIESAGPSSYLKTEGQLDFNIDVNGNQWFFKNDGTFILPGGIKPADVTTDIVLGTDDGSDTGNISAYRTYQLRDGNDNVLMQIQNEDGVGKLKFDGGSNGIWYDGGVVIKGVGYQADNTSIQPMSFNSATGAVTYGQLNYNHFVGFPRLPNYANDAAANTAAGTPLKGMQYYNTTTDKAMVYTASGWQAMN